MPKKKKAPIVKQTIEIEIRRNSEGKRSVETSQIEVPKKDLEKRNPRIK